MHVDPHTLGQRIAGLRHGQGWSQRRLAEAAGVSHGYVALLELGRLPSPGKFRLDAIARALNLRTSDALLGPALVLDGLEPSTGPAFAASAGPAFTASAGLEARAAQGAVPSRTPAALHLADESVAATHRAERPANPLAERLAQSRPTTNERVELPLNVLGGLDQVCPVSARPLPVFRWGSCGDPRDRESPPDPDHLEFPPPGRETLIGPNGFGVVVKGESMAGRGIEDGDVVWVNPERPYQIGKVVLALVSDEGGDAGMVVKTYARTDVGECLLSETAEGRSPVVCREFKIIGPVVGITSWRLPS